MPNQDGPDIEKEVQDVERNPLFQLVYSVVGKSPLGRGIMVVVAVLIVLGGIFYGSKLGLIPPSNSGNSGDAVTPFNPGSSAGSSNTGDNINSSTGLPAQSFKQTAKEITYNGCPPEGDGGDPVLNNNKNRVDVGNFQPVAFDAIEKLPWPSTVERKAHADWSAADQAQIAQAEGLPVQVEGYLAEARQEGPETPNCHSSTDFDFHIWMLRAAGGTADRVEAIVIEATPRVRANHPGWTVNALNAVAKAGTKVRVSGWLMLDPEHPDQVGKTRGTIWEIHPIIELEVFQNGQWTKLDNYQP